MITDVNEEVALVLLIWSVGEPLVSLVFSNLSLVKQLLVENISNEPL